MYYLRVLVSMVTTSVCETLFKNTVMNPKRTIA